MDDRRTRFFWSLSLILGVLILLWETYSLTTIHKQRTDYETTMKHELGADVELDSVISYLEARLEERAEFKFKTKDNPMDLSRAIFLTDNTTDHYRLKQMNTIRVSAVVFGAEPAAVVQYKGQNMQLAIGDSVAGERVVSITPEGMVTLKNGHRKPYPITGVSMTPEEIKKLQKRKRYATEESY